MKTFGCGFGLVAVGIGMFVFNDMLSRLSQDALALALGLCFGILAGIPMVLILLAAKGKPEELQQQWRMEDRPTLPPPNIIILSAQDRQKQLELEDNIWKTSPETDGSARTKPCQL